MFNNQRYITRGIIADIPEMLQAIMWHNIDSMEGEKDYLQVFVLEQSNNRGKPIQKIVHTQERPPYKKEIFIPFSKPVNAKIFVIDDQTHCTMLLASEY